MSKTESESILVVHSSTVPSSRRQRQCSYQSIASGLLHFWDSLNFKKDNSVIHGFISAGRANYYMPSLKAGSIVKVDHFEIARCSSMYKITDHPFIIRFISPTIIDKVITGAPEINLQS
ncbi:hypothetical protein DY000_02020235 [Brassica cretica]|uniref:DUF223 domain-containing protein n=1 Tax=Brassica cretica TaxID=69181 RepID=A0ABQ7EML2_BRACR|nr:hypothetical protein DY000_02020235 [Brassica cretica]